MLTKLRAAALAALTIIISQGLVANASATIITLNFGSLPLGAFTTPVHLDGFVLTPILGTSSKPTIVNAAGTNVLGSTNSVYAGGADTILTRVNGGNFTLLSVAAAALNGDTGYFAIGINPGTGGITLGTRFGLPLTKALTTFDLSSRMDFQNILSVDLDPVNLGDGDVVGRITVSFTDVPEPVSLSLLGASLLGLATLRRRRA